MFDASYPQELQGKWGTLGAASCRRGDVRRPGDNKWGTSWPGHPVRDLTRIEINDALGLCEACLLRAASMARRVPFNSEIRITLGQTRSVRENFETRRLLADRQRRSLQRVAGGHSHRTLG